MRRTTFLAVCVLITVTVVSGVVHGRLSRRWGASADLVLAGEALAACPTRIGSWEMQSSAKLSEYAESVLECTNYVNRTYVHDETGEQVSVALIVGPAGPIATHSPDVCFSSRSFQLLDDRKVVTLPAEGQDGPQQLWVTTFTPASQAGDLLRVYYGWNDGGGWRAPRDPRLAFLGRPYLYKLQAAATLPVNEDPKADDPCRRFLGEFLAAAQSTLLSRRAK